MNNPIALNNQVRLDEEMMRLKIEQELIELQDNHDKKNRDMVNRGEDLSD